MNTMGPPREGLVLEEAGAGSMGRDAGGKWASFARKGDVYFQGGGSTADHQSQNGKLCFIKNILGYWYLTAQLDAPLSGDHGEGDADTQWEPEEGSQKRREEKQARLLPHNSLS